MSCSLPEVPLRPSRWNEITDVFGDPVLCTSADGFVTWERRWEEQNMMLLNTTVPYPKRVYCHCLIAYNLKSILCEVYESGNGGKIFTWDGCFHVRRVRKAVRRWSLHSLGLAVDLNAQWNPCGVDWKRNNNERKMDPSIVRIFEKHGWIWGQNFRRKDPMHFGICYW